MKKGPSHGRAFLSKGCAVTQAVASQYSALNGLLMRSANGDTSNNLSVGIFSPVSVVKWMPDKS